MIRSLKIEGVRGFRDFQLNDLGRVNLLVGTNNCGKTTILESVQMLTAPGDLLTVYRSLSRRGEDWWGSSERTRSRYVDVRRLFTGHEIRPGASFALRATGESGCRELTAAITESRQPIESTQRELFDADQGQVEPDELLAPLTLALRWTGLQTVEVTANISRRGGLSTDDVRRRSNQISPSNSQLITTAALNSESVVDLFESIVLTPEEQLVVDSLRIIEPSIERIATGNTDRSRFAPSSDTGRGGILVRCSHINDRIPIGSMGDGIWRMLGLALALVSRENGILLVDEIDTGLHYTVMADLWRLVYKTAKRLNVQVFATTHSRDCYESLAAICREQTSEGSDITIQRIERGKSVAVAYTEQEIVAAAARGMEVR